MRKSIQLKALIVNPLTFFATLLFFICLADGIMSYVTPVFIENSLKDPFIVGVILALSSVWGMFFDFLIAKKLSRKNYKFFVMWMLVFAMVFPLIFLYLPRVLVVFILAMITWSIYYEFRDFSQYDFVHRFVPFNSHTTAWSVLSTFQSLAYMLGPGIAVVLLDKNEPLSLYVVVASIGVALLVYLLLQHFLKKGRLRSSENEVEKTVRQEFKVLWTLLKRIWPLIMFQFSLTLVDVSFWTTGILYAENLRGINNLGNLFMVIYGLPALFIGLIAPNIYKKAGKKRTAFVVAAASGSLVGLIGIITNVYGILSLVFLSSGLSGIAFILLSAAYEDYISRLNLVGNDLISLRQFAGNFAYAAGPVFLGFVAKSWGFGSTFSVVGILLLLVSVFSLVIVPRKIKMPQKELITDLGL